MFQILSDLQLRIVKKKMKTEKAGLFYLVLEGI